MNNGKIVCAVIGVGAAGGAIAEAAVADRLGTGLAINSSVEDIGALAMIPPDRRIKIGNTGGAGKNRAVAYDAVKSDVERIMDNVHQFITGERDNTGLDILFVAMSGGGGTGSGAGPILCKILKSRYPNVRIVPIVALPAEYERGIVQQNAIDCVREIQNLNFTYIIMNNDKVTADLLEEKYDSLNHETTKNLVRLVHGNKSSKISNIDVADRLSMFSDPGVLVVGSALVDIANDAPLHTGIKMAIDATPMSADITGNVMRAAIQCECDKTVYTEKNIIAAQSIFKNVAGIFEGYYDAEKGSVAGDESGINRVLVAYSGAKLSEKWIRERENIIAETKPQAVEKVEISKGNAGLKSAWGTGANSQSSSGMVSNADIFAEFETDRT